MEQGSHEWFQARLGRVTASRLGDVMAVTKSGPSEKRRAYLLQLLIERITETPTETYVSAAMAHGSYYEPAAKAAYEWLTDQTVRPVGFLLHPMIDDFGASPDGLVGDDGLIEIKCPTTPTHVGSLLGDAIKPEYILQMTGQMMCAGKEWCDFVTYDPRLPAPYQVRVQRVHRDEGLVKEIAAAVRAFLRDLENEKARLDALVGARPSNLAAIPPRIEAAAQFLAAG